MEWVCYAFSGVSAILLGLLLSMRDQCRRKERRLKQLEAENDRLSEAVSIYLASACDLECKEAYQQGLDNGRKTDTLYRQLLSRLSGKERATVLLKGGKEK